MQICPALRNFVKAARSSVFSRSQSSKTSTGAWPPSSIVVRFTPSAHSLSRCLPTGTEPVKLTLRITGDAIRCRLTISGTPNTSCAASAGTPASITQCISAIVQAGVSSGGLEMIEQPAAKAAAIFLLIRLTGKFHGLNAATGPMGCFNTRLRCPVGRTSTRP